MFTGDGQWIAENRTRKNIFHYLKSAIRIPHSVAFIKKKNVLERRVLFMDLIVRKALLRDSETTVDIGISGGKIIEILPEIEASGKTEIDAGGKLVTPTFIDPHIHLDKILIAETVRDNVSGTLAEAIEIIWERKRNYDRQEVMDRAERVINWAIQNGTTIMRTHVDIDTVVGLKALEPMLALKEKVKDYFDLQVVAFPQEGIIQDPGTDKLMEEAIKMGADLVGGMPHNEMTPVDSTEHVDFCFKLAKKYDKDIDMHVDETDDENSRTLQYYAAKTIKEDYQHRVSAGHTCALSAYNEYYAAKVITLVKKAEMNMETNPATNLMLEGRYDQGNIRRGLTRVKQLMEAGVNVTFGQDCIKDTFYPTFGQADLLEVGMLLAHAVQLSMPHEVERIYDMCTYGAAKMLRLKDYGIEVGKPASFNIIDAPNVLEALRTRADRLYVIKKGRVLSRTKTQREMLLPVKA
jgi:cytosine/creatinine deaminase